MDMKIEQHIIIKFLWNKGADPIEILSGLMHIFQEDIYTRWRPLPVSEPSSRGVQTIDTGKQMLTIF
jgi:hypothetical protein